MALLHTLSHLLVTSSILSSYSRAAPATVDPALRPNDDLSEFSREPLRCPAYASGSYIFRKMPCEHPQCRGISWAAPPYRCRRPDGVYDDESTFGCPCCPRVIACEDPLCEGSDSEERCRTQNLRSCLCRSKKTEAELLAHTAEAAANSPSGSGAPETVPGLPTAQTDAVETPGSCPRNPPVLCMATECRGANDWQTAATCNNPDGLHVIDGIETPLMGCPCCPEMIACAVPECSGDAERKCTSDTLRGCFCDWPRGGTLGMENPLIWAGMEATTYNEEDYIPHGNLNEAELWLANTGALRAPINVTARHTATVHALPLPSASTLADDEDSHSLSISVTGLAFIIEDGREDTKGVAYK